MWRFIEGQTRTSMQRGARMSLALNAAYKISCSSFKFKPYLQAYTTTSISLKVHAKQPTLNYRGPTPNVKS